MCACAEKSTSLGFALKSAKKKKNTQKTQSLNLRSASIPTLSTGGGVGAAPLPVPQRAAGCGGTRGGCADASLLVQLIRKQKNGKRKWKWEGA